MTPCDNCPNWDWCKANGCTIWNGESRRKLREEARRNQDNRPAEVIIREDRDAWPDF